MTTTKKKGVHYIDNKEFHAAMIAWKELCKEAEEAGEAASCRMELTDRLPQGHTAVDLYSWSAKRMPPRAPQRTQKSPERNGP